MKGYHISDKHIYPKMIQNEMRQQIIYKIKEFIFQLNVNNKKKEKKNNGNISMTIYTSRYQNVFPEKEKPKTKCGVV